MKLNNRENGWIIIEYPKADANTKRNKMTDDKSLIEYPCGDTYLGETHNWNKSKRHGHGIYKSSDKSFSYIGYWKNDKMHGEGTIKLSKYNFEGIFKNNEMKYGKLTEPDGSYYEGGFSGSFQKGGHGEYWGKAIHYKGQYLNNKRHGEGSLWKGQFGEDFKGIWEDGKLVQGTKEQWGAKYTGKFKDLKYHGDGILVFQNKDKFVGEFENGRYKSGKYYLKKECIEFGGTFKNDKVDGTGFQKQGSSIYFGAFLNGNRHGLGMLENDEIIYQGEFENNQFHGIGEKTVKKTGELIEGKWRDGELIK